MFFTDSWNCIRGDRFRIDAPFESKGLFWGRNVGEMGSIIPGSRGRMVSGCQLLTLIG